MHHIHLTRALVTHPARSPVTICKSTTGAAHGAAIDGSTRTKEATCGDVQPSRLLSAAGLVSTAEFHYAALLFVPATVPSFCPIGRCSVLPFHLEVESKQQQPEANTLLYQQRHAQSLGSKQERQQRHVVAHSCPLPSRALSLSLSFSFLIIVIVLFSCFSFTHCLSLCLASRFCFHDHGTDSHGGAGRKDIQGMAS